MAAKARCTRSNASDGKPNWAIPKAEEAGLHLVRNWDDSGRSGCKKSNANTNEDNRAKLCDSKDKTKCAWSMANAKKPEQV